MAPATVMIDPIDNSVGSSQRALLLAPPSLASHSSALASIVSQYDRSITDLQMLDRLSAGLVSLPSATYDLILVLADSNASLSESLSLLSRNVVGSISEALRPKGTLQAQDSSDLSGSAVAKEAILAGLVSSGAGFEKPDYGADEGTVTLKLGGKKNKSNAGPAVGSTTINVNGNNTKVDLKPAVPAGVGFDFGDDLDLDDYDDDDIIDEETLMTDADLKRPINVRKYLYCYALLPCVLFPSC